MDQIDLIQKNECLKYFIMLSLSSTILILSMNIKLLSTTLKDLENF